ncbi:MAG TPA: APC family permease [Micromonosporaceae bacterium]|nr:APC family permease [Micromonosporaceae bacterium]
MSAFTLARRTLGTGSLWIFGVSASSPLTVLVGGVIATYATTGVVGVPASFIVITAALALLAVGYVAMSRHVVHAAPFYALLARGFGGTVAAAGAVVALLGYNCIQISLYGLVGVTLAGLLGGVWWTWAAVVWLVVAVLGVTRVTANAKIVGSLLAIELGVITLFDVAAFTHPAEGVLSFAPLTPTALFVNGAGGVFALGMAAFVGFETGPVYGEEARSPAAVRRATLLAVGFLGLFYATSSWAVAVAVGPEHVVNAARDPQLGLPFSVLGQNYGSPVVTVATMLLVTSVIAAMAAFHHACARYVFGMARERILPAGLARLSEGARGGAPLAGSLLQSAVAAAVLTVFVLLGADPIAMLFTWLSTIGALAILTLMVASSIAVYRFFRAGRGGNESWFVRVAAPTLGAIAGGFVLLLMIGNLASLLQLPPNSPLRWLAASLVAAAALAGAVWGRWLRRHRRDTYAAMGTGTPEPIAVLDQRLAALDV